MFNTSRMTYAFCALPIAISTLVAAPVLAADKFATKEEFISAASGKTLTTTTKKGDTFTAMYDAKGGGTFSIGGKTPGQLTWTFKGDTLCSEFKSMKFKECNKVVVSGPAELKFMDAKTGALNNVYSVK
jgi:hypothetical protein